MTSSCVSWHSELGDTYDGDIEVDLVRPLQRTPSPVITAKKKPSRLRIHGILSLSIIDVGQMSRNGKEGVTRSVTVEEGGVHKCIVNGYSSWLG